VRWSGMKISPNPDCGGLHEGPDEKVGLLHRALHAGSVAPASPCEGTNPGIRHKEGRHFQAIGPLGEFGIMGWTGIRTMTMTMTMTMITITIRFFLLNFYAICGEVSCQ
jgi:hypothetical protein